MKMICFGFLKARSYPKYTTQNGVNIYYNFENLGDTYLLFSSVEAFQQMVFHIQQIIYGFS